MNKLIEETLTDIWMAMDALVNLNDKTMASIHLQAALDDISRLRKAISDSDS